MSKRQLGLWMNAERVGTWTRTPGGDQLDYAPGWVSSPQGLPLSLTLPFRPGNELHRGSGVDAFFENLLPDSSVARERLARRFQVSTPDAFGLLSEVGRDCAGALYIAPLDQPPGDVRRIDADPLDEADVARLLRAETEDRAPGQVAESPQAPRVAIAGAQEKTALLWHQKRWWRPAGATPTTHILKLPLGLVGNMRLDLSDSVDNEWLCALVLAAYGLPVARCHPVVFEDQRVLAVERFDRRWSDDGSWITRLPQEDLCQATGKAPHLKYEADGGPGIDAILRLLGGCTQPERDRESFLKAQLIFWMLCAPDGHAKNFSIALHTGGAYSLAPLYDVLSAYPLLGSGPGRLSPHRVKLAMAVRSKNAHWRMQDILRRHWELVGRRNGVTAADGRDVSAIVQNLAERTPAVIEHVAGQVPPSFPARVLDLVCTGLRDAAATLARGPGR